jgi:hypothetical protein
VRGEHAGRRSCRGSGGEAGRAPSHQAGCQSGRNLRTLQVKIRRDDVNTVWRIRKPAVQNAGATRRKLSFKDKHALEVLPGKIAVLEAEIARLQTVMSGPTLFARDRVMFDRTSRALAVVVCAGAVCTAAAVAQPTNPPNLSSDNVTGWVPLNYGDSFVSPADGPGPVVDDPRYPFVSNQTSARTGKRSTFHIADSNNPILQPWAKEDLRKRNEWILSGKAGYSVQVSCIPLGVRAFVLHPVQPLYFIQTAH